MMDLSDGLASDARRLGRGQWREAHPRRAAQPLAPGVDSPELAATGGEDHELLVCGPESLPHLTWIGTVVEGEGVEWIGLARR